jgi:thiamine biosynthesis lipoprotein
MIIRARPLLGTLVAIASDGDEAGVRAAFAALERVHVLMNFHAATGDVARVNRARPGRAVRVDRWTYRVLRQAKELSATSEGAFDVTVPGSGARHADLELLASSRVRWRRRGRLDLGGIAKGFAVDRAVEALRRHGATRGCVNAGGDLRRFGRWHDPVRVRMPRSPWRSIALPLTSYPAIATSGAYYGGRFHDPRRGRPACLEGSITVCAPSCMVADGLTKVVALLGPRPELLDRYRARAFALDHAGRLHAPAR